VDAGRVAELASTVDPAGRRVVLTEGIWVYIGVRHPELRARREEILQTVARPDLVTPDLFAGRGRYWRHSVGPSRWLRVTVDFGAEPARIVMASPTEKGPPEWPSALTP
jgi:hypothetical protein